MIEALPEDVAARVRKVLAEKRTAKIVLHVNEGKVLQVEIHEFHKVQRRFEENSCPRES